MLPTRDTVLLWIGRPARASRSIPATRLSELLAQSLEELTRPFEAPKAANAPVPEPPPVRLVPAPVAAVGEPLPRAVQPPVPVAEPPAPAPVQSIEPPPKPALDPVPEPAPVRPALAPVAAAEPPPVELPAPVLVKAAEPAETHPADDLIPPLEHHNELPPDPTSEQYKADADKAIAELEAELFAAAKQIPRGRAETPSEPANANAVAPADKPSVASPFGPSPDVSPFGPPPEKAKEKSERTPVLAAAPVALEEPHPAPDADAARVIAKVRKLMLVSMAVTLIAVGSVFGFIGYRVYKNEGMTAKTADKLPETATAPADVTLAIPRGARVVHSAVAGDRLVITLDVGGKIEVRTFDVNTLQPAGRLNFSATP